MKIAVAILIILLLNAAPAAMAQAGSKMLPGCAPNTIADIVEQVAPSVVNIQATVSVTRAQKMQMRLQQDDYNRSLKKFGLSITPKAIGSAMDMTGSGVIVNSAGYILTNLHVVANAGLITVTLHDGRSFEANVVADDSFSDLAILKIPADNLPIAKFGNADSLRVGDWVIAIGNQFGLGHTVTHGLVSGLSREAKEFKSFGARTGAVRFIQTDAPINPGSSGGPLLNLNGEVVGINTFIRDDAQNIGFAIPAGLAKETADKLVNKLVIEHPYIGIEMNDHLTAETDGVEINTVKSFSPAAKVGLRPGDVILAVNKNLVRTSDDVSRIVGNAKVGDHLQIKIKRAQEEKMVDIQVDKLPDNKD